MNKINRRAKYFVTLFILVSLNSVAAVKNEVKQLVCEYKTNPIGIRCSETTAELENRF